MKTPTQIVIRYFAVLAVAFVVGSFVIRPLMNSNPNAGYGSCLKCKRTWNIVHGHSTPYKDAAWEVTTPNAPDSQWSVKGIPNDGGTHTSVVTNGVSCFPLCEECWNDLKTPEARLPFYREMSEDRWIRSPKYREQIETDWPKIKAAVLRGE